MAKFVVYTALFGNYDILTEPECDSPDLDFVCFTDQDIESERWKIIKVDSRESAPNILNREYKWLPFQYLDGYEASLYIDANIRVQKDLSRLMQDCLLQDGLWACVHEARTSILTEGLACIVYKKSEFLKTVDQLSRYYCAGFSDSFQLSSNNILIRSHTDEKINAMMREVYESVKKYTGRDQLALPYCAWSKNRRYSLLPKEIIGAEQTFGWVPHRAHSESGLAYKIVRKLVIYSRYITITIPYFTMMKLNLFSCRKNNIE